MKQLYASGNCNVNKILTYNDLIVFLKRKRKSGYFQDYVFLNLVFWYYLPHIVHIIKEYACRILLQTSM